MDYQNNKKTIRKRELKQVQIAKIFNIHPATICYIKQKKTWKHI